MCQSALKGHQHVCGRGGVDGKRTSSSSVSPNNDERGEVDGGKRKRQVSGEYSAYQLVGKEVSKFLRFLNRHVARYIPAPS